MFLCIKKRMEARFKRSNTYFCHIFVIDPFNKRFLQFLLVLPNFISVDCDSMITKYITKVDIWMQFLQANKSIVISPTKDKTVTLN